MDEKTSNPYPGIQFNVQWFREQVAIQQYLDRLRAEEAARVLANSLPRPYKLARPRLKVRL